MSAIDSTRNYIEKCCDPEEVPFGFVKRYDFDQGVNVVVHFSHSFFVEADTFGIDDLLQRLTNEWVADTINLSSLDDIVGHASYRKIIDIGEPALEFIFRDLARAPKPWFFALRKITGANPIQKSDAGRFKAMREAWLCWAAEHDYDYTDDALTDDYGI